MQISTAPRKTLLVVDDNPGWASLVQTTLGSEHHIIQCLKGAEAVAAYAQHLPDWVWMDISMPGVNGFMAACAILARWPNARVLFVTQHNENEFRHEAASIGAVGYLLKDNLADAVDLLSRELAPILSPTVAMQNGSPCRPAIR
ncbi:MAG: response regulator transcription factor [Verrucomicrobiota bacterium]|jgi:CheY-like chemotaxis protein